MEHHFIKPSSVIDKILKHYDITQEKQNIYSFWEQILGEKLAKKISLIGIRKSTLLIKVSSPAYHHQLNLYKKEWLKKLNDILGKEKYKNINVIY